MLVKICGITSEADALLAVGLGADAVGFIFAPSPRQVSTRAVQQIVDRLPRDVLTVGVFRNESPERVVQVVNTIGLRAAQLHGQETSAQTRWVAERVPVTIRAFSAGHPDIEKAAAWGVSAVMVDSASPGSGEVFDWRLAEGVVDPGRLIVSGGLDAENVGDAVAHLRPYGVDVCTGVEAEPGRKDPQRLRAFVVAARRAAREAGLDGGDDSETVDDGDAEVRSGTGPFDWQEET
ncbi:MAG TPA: N-(5'-phosphoribosyl)anthranilate isomerase [Acidimicrobiaceae bacterium]|nr:N-(5'-phosphoribosyl)anthranilate isomerase [Acidimicrobiaceae bacterium]